MFFFPLIKSVNGIENKYKLHFNMQWNLANSWRFWGLGVENQLWLHARLYMWLQKLLMCL